MSIRPITILARPLARASGALGVTLLLSLALGTAAASAQDETFVVATKEAPPFAFRAESGTWSGLSISMWEALADELDIAFRYEEASLADMIDGVADGRFDASVAATTITPARERLVDFSHPFHSTGFGIAIPRADASWWGMARRLFSVTFFGAIGLLALVLTVVGACFWFAERRRNGEEFRPGLKGLGDGFWFSAVTMTTTGYGDMAPRTLAGRLVGLLWMFTALILTSTFTGMIASALTAERLALVVERPADLQRFATGSVANSAADDWLSSRGLAFDARESVASGLEALAAGEIDTFVYDYPLLQHLVRHSHADTLQLVPGTFGRQDYGIALPPGSELREPLNRALLDFLDSREWETRKLRWLGSED